MVLCNFGTLIVGLCCLVYIRSGLGNFLVPRLSSSLTLSPGLGGRRRPQYGLFERCLLGLFERCCNCSPQLFVFLPSEFLSRNSFSSSSRLLHLSIDALRNDEKKSNIWESLLSQFSSDLKLMSTYWHFLKMCNLSYLSLCFCRSCHYLGFRMKLIFSGHFGLMVFIFSNFCFPKLLFRYLHLLDCSNISFRQILSTVVL